MKDTTKIHILLSIIEGLRLDLKSRITSCVDCKWTLEYIDYWLKEFNKMEKEDESI